MFQSPTVKNLALATEDFKKKSFQTQTRSKAKESAYARVPCESYGL